MKKDAITEAIGGIEDRFIAEAMDYKCERRITMSKKKILIIAAIVAVIACMAIPLAAEPTVFFGRGENGEFIAFGRYYDPHPVIDSYNGSLKDGTAVIAEEGSVEITVVEVEDGTIKFVIKADESIAPFDEYGDLLISSCGIYDMVKEKVTSSWADNPFNSVYGATHGNYRGDDLSFDYYYDDDFNLVFVRKAINGVYPDAQQRKIIVYTLAGRNADGDILEIRGEWEVEFMF